MFVEYEYPLPYPDDKSLSPSAPAESFRPETTSASPQGLLVDCPQSVLDLPDRGPDRTEPTGPRVRASEEWTEPTFGGPGPGVGGPDPWGRTCFEPGPDLVYSRIRIEKSKSNFKIVSGDITSQIHQVATDHHPR